MAEGFDHDLRRFDVGRDRARDLTPQRNLPLVGDIVLFAEPELPDRGLEAGRVEFSGGSLEIGIAHDRAHGFGIGLSEPQPPRLFIERRLGNGLLQHLAVDAEGAGLLHRQRTAELAADLLQLVSVELAELFSRNFDMPDLGQRRLSESPEDVGDAPDTETDDQNAHHHGHNGFAEPV